MLTLKNNFTRILTIIAIVSIAILIFSQIFTPAQAAIGINRQINFQGKLVNNPLSTNVTDTSYTVVFTFYDNASGGTQLWQETQTVTTVDGIFRVALGSVTAFPANFNFNWSGLYLGINVNSNGEMTPRIQMAAVPFAFNAEKVSGLTVQDTSGNASTSGTLQIANAKTINLGTQNLTFTTSGDTTLTLPTTGTLLTNTAAANQTVTSTQTTGNVLSLADSTGLTGGITGFTLGLTSSTNSQNKTGISFDLSGGTGATYYDLLGTGSTWNITRAGALTVASCSGCGTGSGVNWWNQLAGALSPVDTTNDFLLGSTATSSALFSFTGIKTGQTNASISGQLIVMANNGWGGNATISGALTLGAFSNGVIQTTNNRSLTIGGATTGDIILSPANNVNGSNVVPGVDNVTDLGLSGARWKTVNAAVYNVGSSTGLATFTGTCVTGVGGIVVTAASCPGSTPTLDLYWNQTSGAIYPNNSTVDFLFGSQASTSANFHLYGASPFQGTNPVASIAAKTSFAALVVDQTGVGDLFTASASGFPLFTITKAGLVNAVGSASIGATLTFKTNGGGTIQTSSNQLLTIGGDTTGNIQFKPGNSSTSLYLGSNGNVGIGTTAPAFDANGGVHVAVDGGTGSGNYGSFGLGSNQSGTTAITSQFSFFNSNIAGAEKRIATFVGRNDGAINSGAIDFYTFNAGSAGTAKMTILSNGNVGIGTTGPGAKLEVTDATFPNALKYDPNTAILSISGPASTLAQMPRMHYNFNGDADAALGYLMYAHDNLAISFDAYHNGSSWVSSYAGSNFAIYKNSNELTIGFNAGTTKGSTFSGYDLTNGVRFSNDGKLGVGGAAGNAKLYVNGNVGIGTTAPLGTLDLRSSANTTNGGTIAIASISGKTSFAALVVDNSGVGDLFTASASGATRFVIRQNGSVGIGTANPGFKLDVAGSARIGNNVASDDIVKSTTSDFTQSGYSTNSVSISNGVSLNINNADSLVAPIAGPSTVTGVASGSAVFRRQNGTIAVLAGVAPGTSKIYNVPTNAFTNGPSLTSTIGSGSAVFQRPDGKFVIVYGNRSDIYDSAGNNYAGTTTKGPDLPQTNGNLLRSVAGAGSRVIPRSDGKFLVLLGGSSMTNLYDPTNNTFIYGPSPTSTVASGSAVLQRPDGRWLIILGGGVATTNIYDPSLGNGGAFSAGPTGFTGTAGVGANVFQMPDGRFMIINGNNSTTTNIYNPATNSFSTGPVLTELAGTGSNSFQRPDGKWVVIIGNGSKATNLYDPTGGGGIGSFSRPTSPANDLSAPVGVGGVSFQRDDGTYMVVSGGAVNGGAGTSTTIFDVGWHTQGSWTSEDLSSTKISTYSAIFWNSPNQQPASPSASIQSSVQVYVKTAYTATTCVTPLANAQYIPIGGNGDLIQAVASANCAKIQVLFNAPVVTPYGQQVGQLNPSGMWASEGTTAYMRYLSEPVLFDLKIQNPLAGYGGILASDASESRNGATSSALLDGIISDNTNRLQLAVSRNFPTATASGGIVIASASADLGASAGGGAHTLQLPNGKFLVITASTNVTRMYDPNTGLFTAGPNLSANAGAGSFSIQLPDGRFMVFLGASNATSIYDPVINLFYAGPSLSSATNIGAGAHAIQRPDGKFLIFRGGGTTLTDIFDPWSMSFTPGPYTPPASLVGAGAVSFRRPDGRYVTMVGGGVAVASAAIVYDPIVNDFKANATNANVVVNTGASAVQLATGRFFVPRSGAAATSQLYNPIDSTFAAGPAGTAVVAGSHTILLPDGKVLIMGITATTYQIYDPDSNSMFAVSGTLPSSLGAGGHAFQRSDGKYVVIDGGSTTNTMIIDAGWNMQGTYITEPIYNPNISANSSLFWKNSGQGSLTIKSRTSSSLIGLTTSAWNNMEAGGFINPASGDTYAQFQFKFQASMPNMPYEKQRIWLGGDSGEVAYYRQLQSPILQYWRLLNTSDPNILTLTSSGLNMYRFGADGQAYTTAGGGWNSGGADLAERYTSTQGLEAGDVVVGDRQHSQNVIRSTDTYQSNIMGVVSTSPGFVAGAYTPDSYPIALVGRVPVKISTENGSVHSGDYLTSASIPGYAMKATVAGRVLGTALEDFDPVNAIDCPKDGAGSLATTQCGTITAFINLTSYNGQNVEVVMADKGFTATDSSGLTDFEVNTGVNSYLKDIAFGDKQTLAFLEYLKEKGDSATLTSQIFTGKVSALTVISPNIVADLITAKTIRADRIEGLEILTNQISSLQNSVSVLGSATDSAQLSNISGELNLSSLNVGGLATISGDLNVGGNSVFNGMLSVLHSISTPNLLVSDFASFFGDVFFKKDVRFEGRTTFNSDTAGFAVIKKGNNFVEVSFDNEYLNTPIVTASIALEKMGDSVLQKQLEDSILNGNVSYVITQRTTKGFIIKLNKSANYDINFSWIALSIKDAKTSGLTPLPSIAVSDSATPSAGVRSILNQLSNPLVNPTPAP